MKDWADLSTELLPLVLQDFVRLIGLPATMKVVERHGGRRLYIPINPTPEHHLAELIGFDNLCKLSKVYGLEDHFDIPKAVNALRHLRDQRIRSQYGPKSASTLAAENNLTERQIWNIVGRAAPENTHQSQLFG
nr:Mor transcription activator family protein [uncultured Albidiferax sp.]